MRRTIRVDGPATHAAMWAAYAHTSRWPRWAPHLRRVEPSAVLQGVVCGWLGVGADFAVAAVDEAAGTWSWSVTSGPVRLDLGHAVGDGWTSLTVDGPAAVVLPYRSVARIALRRLVTT